MCSIDNSLPFSTSTWHVVAASVTGTSHRQMGKGCEDAHAFRVHDTSSLLLLAAADGAGTALHATSGAWTAVQIALDTAETLLREQREPKEEDQWRSILTFILQAAHGRLAQLAQADVRPLEHKPMQFEPHQTPAATPIREFATTLLLAIVTSHWIATLQVGDGAIVIHRQDDTFSSLTPPKQGEYVNETCFLTDANYLFQADYTVVPRNALRAIALLTDGLQMLAMHVADNTPFQPFFRQIFNFASSSDATTSKLQQFLESERVCARTDDDKTLVLAVYQ